MGLLGGGGSAAKKAARIQAEAIGKAIEEQRRQFDITQEQFEPFRQQGLPFLDVISDASTVGGLDQRLRDIFSSETFGGLQDQRQESALNFLSAGGLSPGLRSGAAAESAADIDADLGLSIENLLFGRQAGLVDNSQNAVAQLGGQRQNLAANVGNLLTAQGSALASGELGAAQAKAGGVSNLFGLAGAGLGAAGAAGGFGNLFDIFFGS